MGTHTVTWTLTCSSNGMPKMTLMTKIMVLFVNELRNTLLTQQLRLPMMIVLLVLWFLFLIYFFHHTMFCKYNFYGTKNYVVIKSVMLKSCFFQVSKLIFIVEICTKWLPSLQVLIFRCSFLVYPISLRQCKVY